MNDQCCSNDGKAGIKPFAQQFIFFINNKRQQYAIDRFQVISKVYCKG